MTERSRPQEQYLFIHDALVEAVACGHTEVHARNLLPYINKLDELKEGEVTGLEEEFKVGLEASTNK